MAKATMTRDEIRSKVFAAKNVVKKDVELFGAKLELRQPSLKEILETQDDKDKTRAIAMMLVKYCFVPGTDERVFDSADVDSILQFPFGPEFVRLQEAITQLTGLDLSEAEEELNKNPT